MTKISIRIRDPRPAVVEPRAGFGAALVVRASQLLETDGAAPRSPVRRELLLGLDGSSAEVDVSAGLWGVELALPSGRLLNEQVEVAPGTTKVVTLDLGEAPQAWLDWQFLEGSVPGRRRYEAAMLQGEAGELPSLAGAGKSTPAVSVARTKALQSYFPSAVVLTDAFANASPARRRKIRSQVTVLRFRPRHPAAQGLGSNETQRAQAQWKTLVEILRLDADITDLPGLAVDEQWSVDLSQTDLLHDVWRLGPGLPDEDRRFAMVIFDGSVDLVSLPLPWPRDRVVDDTQLELVLEKREVAGPSRLSLTLCDPRYFGLLSYLKNGALSLAATVAVGSSGEGNLLVETLREKRQNPLAACAAGYSLLGTYGRERQPSWAPWLRNLADWFPALPDGAILHARWLSLSGTAEPGAIKQEFLRAFRRGLPYYSLGLGWLLEGLRQFDDDEACKEAAKLVRQVSLRSDVGQVFTVLSLHASADISSQGPADV